MEFRVHCLSSRLIVIAAVSLLACGCASFRYYAQAAQGQGELIAHRRSLNKVLQDPDTEPELARRLQLAKQARRFATARLGLPDNRSYTGYVELDRSYVVWNVFAAPRYSVDAVPQCFPIAGCVAYRGWFSETAADNDAAALKAAGNDVWVGGVPAYSTLGWFADPILSSMLRWNDDELDSTIFHELAHQLIYVKGDTAFNESFATFVQLRGLQQWRHARGLPAEDDQRRDIDDGFTQLVLDLRNRLKVLYASGADNVSMASGQQREIAAFRRHYAQWRECRGPQDHRYDAWVARPINNARLLPFGLYDQWVPAFAVLFHCAGEDWPAFYASVRRLAAESMANRRNALKALVSDRDIDSETNSSIDDCAGADVARPSGH
ncbi:MAG: aminopeptidase [Rhodanobacter sp.]